MKKRFILLTLFISLLSFLAQTQGLNLKNLTTESDKILGASKTINFFFLKTKIPENWEEKRQNNINLSNFIFFDVRDGIKFPTLIAIFFPENSPDDSEIEDFSKNMFIKTLLTEYDLKDYRRIWQKPTIATEKLTSGSVLKYFGFVGRGVHPTITPIVFSVSYLLLKSPHGSVAFITGFKTSGNKSQYEISNIQKKFASHILKLITSAAISEIKMPEKSPSMKKFLIKKGKFRYMNSHGSKINTGNISTSTSGGKKLFFNFYPDGKCEVIDDYFTGGNTISKIYDNYGMGISSRKKGWSMRVNFDVFSSENPGEYWLIIDFPAKYGGKKIYKLTKNKVIEKYVYVKTPSGWKYGKRKIRGMAINGKVEGFYTTVGVVSVYTPPK